MASEPEHIQIKKLMLDYSKTLRALQTKKVAKTRNSPVGDYTEWLVQKAFDGELKGKSTKGYDMVKREAGRCIKYQIKGRWLADVPNPDKRLSIIRDAAIEDELFDFLIGVPFTNAFEVEGAWKIPRDVIRKKRSSSEGKSQGGGRVVHLQGPIISKCYAVDITECLRLHHTPDRCCECGGGRERDNIFWTGGE